jgi:hypothetical protein
MRMHVYFPRRRGIVTRRIFTTRSLLASTAVIAAIIAGVNNIYQSNRYLEQSVVRLRQDGIFILGEAFDPPGPNGIWVQLSNISQTAYPSRPRSAWLCRCLGYCGVRQIHIPLSHVLSSRGASFFRDLKNLKCVEHIAIYSKDADNDEFDQRFWRNLPPTARNIGISSVKLQTDDLRHIVSESNFEIILMTRVDLRDCRFTGLILAKSITDFKLHRCLLPEGFSEWQNSKVNKIVRAE